MLASPTKAMIYVVDDDLDVLGSLQFLLETDGFAVRTFKSGAALLKDGASDDADCFVIDYKMPNMNGLDLANLLRKRDIDAPIILITGHPDETISDRAAIAGVRHVLHKPHLEDSLVGQIRDLLGDRASRH
jgi:two-component system, LuxR family, response regulator FixJ